MDIIARQLNVNLFVTLPYEYEEFEGQVTYYCKDTNDGSHVSFKLRGSSLLFYLFRTHNPEYDNLVKKVVGPSPLKVTIWSHTPSIDNVKDHNIAIVSNIEEVRIVLAVETKLILSDGNTVQLNVGARFATMALIEHYITIFGEESTKLYLQQLISRSCKICAEYTTPEGHCHTCSALK